MPYPLALMRHPTRDVHLDVRGRGASLYRIAQFFPRLPDASDEAITSLGNRFDILLSAVSAAQYLPQIGDVLEQVDLLDEDVGPNPLHQLFFPDYIPAAFDQRLE